MNDLKRSKKKMYKKQMPAIDSYNCNYEEPIVEMEEERGCQNNNHNNGNCGCEETSCVNEVKGCSQKHDHGHDHHEHQECGCKKSQKPQHNHCEPCEAEADFVVENPCAGEECCNGIRPTYSNRNAGPVALEVERVYDAIQFQIFTDATGPNGQPLYFDYDVVEIDGNVPTAGLANVVIDEVIMNYSCLEIVPGIPTIEDFEVMEIEDNAPCDTVFEYGVCPDRSSACCARNRGQAVSYKERGLTVIVNDLVLELRGHCGCTKIVAYAYPAVREMGGQICRVDSVEFKYNTLSARMCCPSNGRSFRLRQDYRTSLTVDCISKAYLASKDYCGCECDCDCDDYFKLTIPSGIDLICCIEETVSLLINDQVVVLAVSQGINPRVVDTFANVCNFPGCGQQN